MTKKVKPIMRSKTIKNMVLVCLMLTVVLAVTLLSLNTETGIAEAVFFAGDVPMDLQTTLDGIFDRVTISAEYLYNWDGSADYIYVEFAGGGYAVLYRDTYELLELSYTGTPYSGVDSEKKYYCGPSNYYTKNSTGFRNLITDEVVPISESEAFDNAVAIRRHFGSVESAYSLHDESTSTLYSTSVTETNSVSVQSVPSYNGLITGLDLEDGTYIENYQFFLSSPFIGANTEGTCSSVATQLLLNYHNYFTDRRIIDDDYLFEDLDDDNEEITERNPNTCRDPCLMNSYTLGSTDAFYNSIVSGIEPEHTGANGDDIVAFVKNYLNGRGLSNSFTVQSLSSTTGAIHTSRITNEINANLPVIVSLRGSLGGTEARDSGHAVVA